MSEVVFRLVRTNGPEAFDLEAGNRYVLGRGPSSDFPVPDPTISRRHAELCATGDTLEIIDLGSSNGTQVNGNRIERGSAGAFDTLTFGRATFRVEHIGAKAPAGGTIVRQVQVNSGRDAYAHLDAHSERSFLKLDGADAAARRDAFHAVRGVFDGDQPVPLCNSSNRLHVSRSPAVVHGHDRARSRRQTAHEGDRIQVAGAGIDVREDRRRADVHDDVGRGAERQG